MRNDIFIDNNIAKNFANRLDPEYKKLIAWLMRYDGTNPSQSAHLVVSNKLLREYLSSAAQSTSPSNIIVVINKLIRDGRLIKITPEEIKAFQQLHFTKKICQRLRCNKEDRDHIPVVLLSDRRYALSRDKNFIKDLSIFPGFNVTAAKRPQDLPYDS